MLRNKKWGKWAHRSLRWRFLVKSVRNMYLNHKSAQLIAVCTRETRGLHDTRVVSFLSQLSVNSCIECQLAIYFARWFGLWSFTRKNYLRKSTLFRGKAKRISGRWKFYESITYRNVRITQNTTNFVTSQNLWRTRWRNWMRRTHSEQNVPTCYWKNFII